MNNRFTDEERRIGESIMVQTRLMRFLEGGAALIGAWFVYHADYPAALLACLMVWVFRQLRPAVPPDLVAKSESILKQ